MYIVAFLTLWECRHFSIVLWKIYQTLIRGIYKAGESRYLDTIFEMIS